MTGLIFPGEVHGEHQKADVALAAEVMGVLQRHYPGHMWDVEARHDQGVVKVQLMYQDGVIFRRTPHGFLLHISKLNQHDRLQRMVMLAGGELLERFKLRRGKATEDSVALAASNGLDVRGRINYRGQLGLVRE